MFFFFFFFFSQFFPLKNINFIRGTLKSSSVAFSSQFVSVYMSRNICTPQQVRKAMCEISLFLCLSPSLVIAERGGVLDPGSVSCQRVCQCKRRHRLLFSCHGMDTHFLWACERKNGVLFSSWIVFCFFCFFFPLLFSCNNSLLVFYSEKVSVNRGMTWRAHCLVFVFVL